MNTTIPSKQALRYLAALCNASRPTIKHVRASSCSSVRSRGKTSTTRPQLPSKPIIRVSPTPVQPTRTVHSASARRSDSPPPLPDITNHYTLFPQTLPSGPPPSGPFTIALPSLKREFLHLQSQHHPDKYPSGLAHSKALTLSALINSAYRTLSDPLLRAQYLLLHNYDVDVMSEDNASHPTDQKTLMQVMDAQEAIEEATSHGQIDALLAENEARIESTSQKMAEAFERDDAEAAKNECVRLKYWRSLQDGLKDWEPGKEVRLIH